MSGSIYLDHNATTQAAPEVVAEMVAAMQRAWANPSSTHAPGQAAQQAQRAADYILGRTTKLLEESAVLAEEPAGDEQAA